MDTNAKHPAYEDRLPDWELLADVNKGERAIKDAGATYLPPTAGMYANDYGKGSTTLGQQMFNAYLTRAVFHEFVGDTVKGLLGVIHRKPPTIEVPKALEPFVKTATDRGESLAELWRRITAAQLLKGRAGLLIDVPHGKEVSEAMPYVAMYDATAIVNWNAANRGGKREQIRLVVLDESTYEMRENLSWYWVKQARVLATAEVAARAGGELPGGVSDDAYVTALVRQASEEDEDAPSTAFVAPAIGEALDVIPFVFVNTNDLVADPDLPPLLGLARLSLAIYRGEADYRHTLFMQGQATLVREGASAKQREQMTGVGALLDVPMGGKAYYIAAPGSGLAEQRQALENDKAQASQPAIQFMDNQRSSDEASGEALRVRAASRTATLASLQHAAAGAIRDVLFYAGRFLGIDEATLETQIKVEPNLEFGEMAVKFDELNKAMDAVSKGLPWSFQEMHRYMKACGLTRLEFEEEQEQIRAEQTDGLRSDPVEEAKRAADMEAEALKGKFGKDEPDDEEAAA